MYVKEQYWSLNNKINTFASKSISYTSAEPMKSIAGKTVVGRSLQNISVATKFGLVSFSGYKIKARVSVNFYSTKTLLNAVS
jgi:hypothetical protein